MSIENWNKKLEPISLETWAVEYLKFCKSRYTTQTYGDKVREFKFFFEVIDKGSNVVSLTAKKILDYLQTCRRSGYAKNNKVIKNMKAGWSWGEKYLQLPSPNPFRLIEKFPEQRKQLYTPPEKDFWQVFNVCEGQDKIMLLTFLHTAGRRNEILFLRKTDLHFDSQEISLWTRKRVGGLEEDRIPMTDELYNALLQQVQTNDSEYVFIDPTTDEPYKKRQHWLENCCKRAGVKQFGFHAIRRLAASILAKNTVPLPVIQAILRHHKVSTTDRYIKNLATIRPHLQVLSGGKFTSNFTSIPIEKGASFLTP